MKYDSEYDRLMAEAKADFDAWDVPQRKRRELIKLIMKNRKAGIIHVSTP